MIKKKSILKTTYPCHILCVEPKCLLCLLGLKRPRGVRYFSKEKDESLKYGKSGSHPKSLIVVAILTVILRDKISPSQLVTYAQNNDTTKHTLL